MIGVLLPTPSAAAAPMPSGPADKTTARELFFEAAAAMKKKDYALAAELFDRSNRLYPAPTAALGLARALTASGKLVQGFEIYNALVRGGADDAASGAFKQAWQQGKQELAKLKPRLPSLVIIVSGATQPAVTIDGESVPLAALEVKRYVDPGTRTVEVRTPGFLDAVREVTLKEGATVAVRIDLAPTPKEAAPRLKSSGPREATTAALPKPAPPRGDDDGSPAMRTAGVVIGGIGIASLVVYGVTGALFVSNKSLADQDCTLRPGTDDVFDCKTQAGVDAAERAQSIATVNTVFFFTGIAASGAGLALILAGGADGEPVTARVTPSFGPGGGGLTWRITY